MLRFIRKYQLIILVVGGSLLMVVFLLQPVLTKLAPSPDKAKVARLDDGTTYNRAQRREASNALSVLDRVYPRALASRAMGGIGLLETIDANRELHWMLLVKQADEAGLIGGVQDGASWIADLALLEARSQVRSEVQQGLIRTQEQELARLQEVNDRALSIIQSNALGASGLAGSTERVYTILAQARGIQRLLRSLSTVPTYSNPSMVQAAHTLADAVAVNAVVLDSSLATAAVPEPTEQQLQTFFETYQNQSPADNEFQVGYIQPTRIQLGYLTLDKEAFASSVNISRVELMKIYQKDRVKYPGDFGLEKIALERQLREDIAANMMDDADRSIRAQISAAIKGQPKINGSVTLPDDWDTTRPRLEDLAELIVERINDQYEVSLPTPAITIIGDRWLTARDILALPGFGQASYRIGSRQLPASTLPQFFELEDTSEIGLDVQVGLPMSDPPAIDQAGNRYFAVILAVRQQGPADSIDDVSREDVIADYKSIEAYKLLSDKSEEFKLAISTNASLRSAIDLATAFNPDPDAVNRPGILRNLLIRKYTIDQGNLASFVDPRLRQSQDFRDQVLEAASTLDPLATPEQVAENPLSVVVPLPASRSLALALVVAPRPVSIEEFPSMVQGLAMGTLSQEGAAAAEGLEDPFAFESLAQRFGLERLNMDEDERKELEDQEAERAAARAKQEAASDEG